MLLMARVAHIINALPSVGGAERLVLELCRCSFEKPVPVITWQTARNALLEQDRDGAIEHIPLRPFKWRNLVRAWKVMKAADVLHVHLFPSLYVAALLPKPKVFTEHNTTNRRRKLNWLRPVERMIYRRYEAVATLTPGGRSALAAWLGKDSNLVIVENGIPVSAFKRRMRKLPTGRVDVGMAARFTAQKDQDSVVRSLTFLPDHVHVHFAGDGPRLPDVRALAEELGVADRVHFHGIVTDIPVFLDNLTVYVLATHWEGYGLAACEAMASGLPTFGSDVDGLREVLPPPLMFPDADAEALARLISDLTSNPAAYERASREALEYAQAFDIKKTYAAYAELYERVAACK